MGLSYMNLSDCFNVITQIYHYDIAGGDYFFYGILDMVREDTTANQVYYVIFDKNGVQVDTDYCKNSKLNITKSYLNQKVTEVAVEIYKEWGYDILNYNLANKFYTDICSHYETIDHYDVLLDDRYTYFYENSTYYFCEEQCEMTDVYPETSEIFCECLNKNNTLDSVDFVKYVIEEQRFKDQPFQHFLCANRIIIKWTFNSNIPNYILIFCLILQIKFCIYFYRTGRKPFYSFIHNKLLVNATDEQEDNQNTHRTKDSHVSNPPKRVSMILNQVKDEQNEKDAAERQIGEQYAKVFIMNQDYDEDDFNGGNEKRKMPNGRRGSTNPGGDLSSSFNSEEANGPRRRAGVAAAPGGPNVYTSQATGNGDDEVSRLARQLKLEQQEKKFAQEILVKYPDTTYCFLYSFCIKRKHKILSLFYNKDVYEIFSFKVSFLILSYSIDFLIPTMLFLNSHIRSFYHKKHHTEPVYDIGFGILSAMISYLIVKFLKWVMDFKSSFKRYTMNGAEEDKREYYHKINTLFFNLKVKFMFYYIFTICGTIFIWYFITTFISTYPNTQLSWGIKVISNIVISLIFPFIYYSIVVLLQYLSLNKYMMKLYKVAMFLLRF